MNEQDEKILMLYIRNRRKKRIAILIITILFVLCSINVLCIYVKNNEFIDIISNTINFQNTKNYSIVNGLQGMYYISNNYQTIPNNLEMNNSFIENKIGDMNEDSQQITSTESGNKKQKNNMPKTKSNKPLNKDFLFKDGYNMENVYQAAREYLESIGHAGKCVPIKDEEGICIGMRVVFN